MEPSPAGTATAPPLAEVVAAALRLARESSRAHLADLVESAAARLTRQDVLVAILGEFKQGKSSLINGLLGERVLTVDDDLATAAPAVVRFGTVPTLRVRRRVGEETVTQDVPFDSLVEVGSERGQPAAREGVECLEVELPNRFLEHGLVLIDTPGFGSIRSGYDDLTLAALRTADGVLFVSDASAPLSTAEVNFLARAVKTATSVVVVMTKADLYAETPRILEVNRAILRDKGLDVPVVAVSTALREAAFQARDAELNEASGFPTLLAAVQTNMLAAKAEMAAAGASRETGAAMAALAASLEAEAGALRDPASAGESVRVMQEAQAALDKLRGPGSRWSQVIGDGYADLVSEVDYRFRGSLREALRAAEEAIEASDPKDTWEDITTTIRSRMGEAANAIVVELEAGAELVDARAAQVLETENVGSPGARSAGTVDVQSLWRANLTGTALVKQVGGTAFTGLRGAQGGIIMFGLMTNLAGLVLTTGATLGIGAIFGGKQIFDDRRRQTMARRQEARQAVRQFVDDVQFEASKSLRDLGRDLQRQARDRFSAHMTTTSQELTASIERVRAAANAEEGERRRQLAAAEQRLAAANEIMRLLPGAALQ